MRLLVIVAVVPRGAESVLERWLDVIPGEAASLHLWATDDGDAEDTTQRLAQIGARFAGAVRWATHGAEDDRGSWLAEQADLVPAELLVLPVRRAVEGGLDVSEREIELLACAVGPVLVLVEGAPVAHRWRIARGRRVHALRRHAIVADALGLWEKDPARPALRVLPRSDDWARAVRESAGPLLLLTGRQPVF